MTVRPPRNNTPRFDAMLGLLADPAHAALAQFPTTEACDWQWTPLIDNVRSVNLTGAPREMKPIVAAIDDWNRNWRLGVIFECAVGPGDVFVLDMGDPVKIVELAKQMIQLSGRTLNCERPLLMLTSSPSADTSTLPVPAAPPPSAPATTARSKRQ